MPRPGWLLFAAVVPSACVLVRRALAGEVDAGPPLGPWRAAARRLHANRGAMAGVYVLIAFATLAALAPLLAPFDPSRQLDIVALRSQAPSTAHLFGTDQYSRDVLSRVIHGGRVSLSVALLAVVLAISAGTTYGAIAGYAGGRLDAAMMRVLDALLSIPRLLLLIGILAAWGRLPLPVLVIVLGVTGWFGMSRIVRGQVMSLRESEFVLSARALGASGPRVLARHILPNVLSPVIVAATLGVGNVIILEAGLSYLGIGVSQPQASWGSIIHDGANDVASLWWIALFPGLAIVSTVMAVNTLGDGLRDALDPRQLPGR